MCGNTVRTTVNFYFGIRHAKVYLLLCVLIRTGVAVILKNYMIINIYTASINPRGYFVRNSR